MNVREPSGVTALTLILALCLGGVVLGIIPAMWSGQLSLLRGLAATLVLVAFPLLLARLAGSMGDD